MNSICLVTKLKSSVNNDDLNYLGGLRVRFKASNSNDRTLQCTGADRAIIVKGGDSVYFTSFDNTMNYGNEVTQGNGILSSASLNFVKVSPGAECEIIVFNKYNLKTLDENNQDINIENLNYVGVNDTDGVNVSLNRKTNEVVDGEGIDIGADFFKDAKINALAIIGSNAYYYMRSIQYLNPSGIRSINVSNVRLSNEDLHKVFKMQNLTALYVNRSFIDIPFTLDMIGALTNIQNITLNLLFGNETVNLGRIEDFVASQRLNGRVSCSAIVWRYPNYLTFNGNSYKGDISEVTLSWTSNTITFNGVTINA